MLKEQFVNSNLQGVAQTVLKLKIEQRFWNTPKKLRQTPRQQSSFA